MERLILAKSSRVIREAGGIMVSVTFVCGVLLCCLIHISGTYAKTKCEICKDVEKNFKEVIKKAK